MTSDVLDSSLINIRSKHGEEKPKEKCPRCESRDTKFCYYNNYNTSQPRHFCRSCRRYWTLGGSLRNVPIGGNSRSNKRLRPNPSPSTLDHHHLYSVSQLMAEVVSPFDPPLFRFDLGLGLGPGTASMEDVGFGMGPTGLQVWGLDPWRLENGGAVTGECGGGPGNEEVR